MPCHTRQLISVSTIYEVWASGSAVPEFIDLDLVQHTGFG
jgi:hypothetical protein